MPFFNMRTPDEIRIYCQNQSLSELYALKRRYGNFFEEIGGKETLNKQEIIALEKKINEIKVKIEEEANEIEQTERYRQHILDNLPGNSAERHLVLQSLNYSIIDNRLSLENELNQLTTQKNKLDLDNAWICTEMRACSKELKIINEVIEGKELSARFERSGLIL